MTQRLKGKSAVITGGGRGIGKAIALAYAREGARCVVTSRRFEDLEQTAGEAPDGLVTAVACDVSDDSSVIEMADRVHEMFGGVDIVVNNAGIHACLLYTSPSPRDRTRSRMPSSA